MTALEVIMWLGAIVFVVLAVGYVIGELGAPEDDEPHVRD
jgi:hypothetical protein